MPLLTSIMAASRRRVDPDAADYFARIVAAGSTISEPNKAAVNAFVAGCKADGIWAAIKASCLLAGPDDLTGALVPLVGAAPTNFNFVAGDYNRVTGLVGNGSTKYLNSNRNNNADPQNNRHLAIYATSISSGTIPVYAGGDAASGSSQILYNTSTNMFGYRLNSSSGQNAGAAHAVGLMGASRPNASQTIARNGGSQFTNTDASASPTSFNMLFFRRNNTAGVSYANARLSYYSIGEFLDLALLDARLTTYMSALT